eukprot:TRINITY_DN5255_c0_g1_i1.p1 TRINITY_DN5255_c0_g1~~TRINITY_DN5255_c0_g1_i1.p1  ORF type:complete len:690 (-),score=37.70 TRINITY_DN5255_c0_g1_i1:81-2150(-)
MEMDALAIANAKVVKDISRHTGIVVGDAVCEDGGRVDGDAGLAFDAGSVKPMAGASGAVGTDGSGTLMPLRGTSRLPAMTGGGTGALGVGSRVAGPLLPAADGGDGADRDVGSSQSSGEDDDPDVRLAVGPTGNDGGGAAGAGDGDLDRVGRTAAMRRDRAVSPPRRLVFARQPVVKPSAPALAAVQRALAALRGREDAEDACRELFINSILLFVGNHESATRGLERNTTEHCWRVLVKLTSAWWPYRESPTSRSKPVPGTAAFKRSSGRLAATSRWCFKVEIDGVHDILNTLSAPAARCLQQPLPATEDVERFNAKDKLKLTALVAAVLLLASKEEDYTESLNELVATGVGHASKGRPLSAAKCQSFISTGLVGSTGGSGRPSREGVLPSDARAARTGRPLHPAATAPSFFDGLTKPGVDVYGEVKTADVKAAALASKEVRAQRREHLNERRLSRGTPPVAPAPDDRDVWQGLTIDQSSLGLPAHLLAVPIPPSRPPTSTLHALPPHPGHYASALHPPAVPVATEQLGPPRLPLAPPPRRRCPPSRPNVGGHVPPSTGAKRARFEEAASGPLSGAGVQVRPPDPTPVPFASLAVDSNGLALSAQPPLAPSCTPPSVGRDPSGAPPMIPPVSSTQAVAERRAELAQQHLRVEASYSAAQASWSQLMALRFPHGTADGSPDPNQNAFGRS